MSDKIAELHKELRLELEKEVKNGQIDITNSHWDLCKMSGYITLEFTKDWLEI